MTVMLDLRDPDGPRCGCCRAAAVVVYTGPLGGLVAAYCTRHFLDATDAPAGCVCTWTRDRR